MVYKRIILDVELPDNYDEFANISDMSVINTAESPGICFEQENLFSANITNEDYYNKVLALSSAFFHMYLIQLGEEQFNLYQETATFPANWFLEPGEENLPAGLKTRELVDLLKHPERPTAFVVTDDFLGVSLEQSCRDCGLSVPNDISIISFNNSLFAQLATPPLTSIDINSVQLGMEAATQIIKHMENPNLSSTKIIVPHTIIERESCQKIENYN